MWNKGNKSVSFNTEFELVIYTFFGTNLINHYENLLNDFLNKFRTVFYIIILINIIHFLIFPTLYDSKLV